MSYESIASSVFTNLRSRLRDLPSRLKESASHVFTRRPGRKEEAPPEVSDGARDRAIALIEIFTFENATLFQRLERWSEREERLRVEGIPSESAANRANRAREEILAALVSARGEVVSEYGEDGGRAFDAELRRACPRLHE